MSKLSLVLVVWLGCSSTTNFLPAVTHQAEVEFDCTDVSVDAIDAYTYLATGCGCVATYECANPDDDSAGCARAPNLHGGDACAAPDAGMH